MLTHSHWQLICSRLIWNIIVEWYKSNYLQIHLKYTVKPVILSALNIGASIIYTIILVPLSLAFLLAELQLLLIKILIIPALATFYLRKDGKVAKLAK